MIDWAEELNRQMLARWERLWLDPDWDRVGGHKKAPAPTAKPDDEQPE